VPPNEPGFGCSLHNSSSSSVEVTEAKKYLEEMSGYFFHPNVREISMAMFHHDSMNARIPVLEASRFKKNGGRYPERGIRYIFLFFS